MQGSAERMTRAMRALEAAYLIDVEGATQIWLVRHGDCYEGMADGDTDPPLSPLGWTYGRHAPSVTRSV